MISRYRKPIEKLMDQNQKETEQKTNICQKFDGSKAVETNGRRLMARAGELKHNRLKGSMDKGDDEEHCGSSTHAVSRRVTSTTQ